jgi:enoyl-CoA hydratase/carnithine racemase
VATMNADGKLTQMNTAAKPAQIRLTRRTPAYWRVTIDNPSINVLDPEMVEQFREVIVALEIEGSR